MSLVARCHRCCGLRPGQVNPKRAIFCQCLGEMIEEHLTGWARAEKAAERFAA